MKEKYTGFLLVFFIFGFIFSACIVEFDPMDISPAEAYGNITGEATGSSTGFSGGPITVTLIMENGKIVDAIVVGDKETPGIGARVISSSPRLIVAKNSPDIDIVSGATSTSNAVKSAGMAALERLISAGGGIDIKMKPGIYGARAVGFGGPFDVLVTLSERSILKIEIEDSNESIQVGKPAIPILIDRIIENQNSEADIVSGATITSNAIKLAVREILENAGAPLSMTTKPKNDEIEKYNRLPKTVDVLVIGSGAAGMSAAIEAAFAGASVTLIEKEDFIGGSTKFSGGVIYAAVDNDDVDNNTMRNYLLFRAQNYALPALLDTYAKKSLELVDGSWIIPPAELSAAFPAGMSSEARARTVKGQGPGLMRLLEYKARENGVTILTGVKATKLEKNFSGVVVSVLAESRESNYTFNVRKGVVVATGGFDNDRSGLLSEYNADSKDFNSRSSIGNVGEGIKLAREIGAATVFKGGRLGWAIIDPTVDYDITSGYDNIVVITGSHALNLDLTAPLAGVSDDGTILSSVNWADPTFNDDNSSTGGFAPQNEGNDQGAMFTGILKALKASPSTFLKISDEPIPSKGYITKTYLDSLHFTFTTDTVAELIEKAYHGVVTVSELQARYTERGWGNSTYYASIVQPSSIGSMGGLKINTNAQVIGNGQAGTVNGQPIPGLYAAGEVANGDFYYQQNPALGSSLGIALTFGRIAGQQAAAQPSHILE